MQTRVTLTNFAILLFGGVVGFALAWWMDLEDAPVMFAISIFAGVFYARQAFREAGFYKVDFDCTETQYGCPRCGYPKFGADFPERQQ